VAAVAAGPFDGHWKGDASGSSKTGGSRGVGEIAADVNGDSVTGTVKIANNAPRPFKGTVGPDGTFSTPGGVITGKFSGNSFTGAFPDGPACNNWRVEMSR
jgi:hypothetical protein